MEKYTITVDQRVDLQAQATELNEIEKELLNSDLGKQFAKQRGNFSKSIETLLDAGAVAEDIRDILRATGESKAAFQRLNEIITFRNKAAGTVGKTGGKGGPKKATANKKKAAKKAKKAAKAKPSATIEEQSLAAGLAAFTANHNTNFAESKIDGTAKTASATDLVEIERIAKKSARVICNNPSVITDAIAKAKPSKAKPSKAKPSNGKAKPKVHAGNRIAKELASVE